MFQVHYNNFNKNIRTWIQIYNQDHFHVSNDSLKNISSNSDNQPLTTNFHIFLSASTTLDVENVIQEIAANKLPLWQLFPKKI